MGGLTLLVLVLCIFLVSTTSSTSNVLTIAGSIPYRNGKISVAKFYFPDSIVVDSNGDLIITDTGNHRIGRISVSKGTVSTIAGSIRGFEDGPSSVAKFNTPFGVAIDSNGDIIIADSGNHRIRRISASSGYVTTIAGSFSGFEDGPSSVAKFNEPVDVIVDFNGDFIVADRYNHRIRKVSISTGTVSTIAGDGIAGFGDGPYSVAKFNEPFDIAIDSNGDIIVADTLNHRIRRISVSTGTVSTISGDGIAGFEDGPSSVAKFHSPFGVDVHTNGDIIIADRNNHRIRRILKSNNTVVTIAGGDNGYEDGNGQISKFAYPQDVDIDDDGDVFIADSSNHVIRKFSASTRNVSTIAGFDIAGFGDGPSSVAKFNVPFDIAIDSNGDIIVADTLNHRIRRISVSTGTVSTIAGDGIAGFEDGPSSVAKFNVPSDIAIDNNGDIIVADRNNHRIRRISVSTGTVSTIAGDGIAGFEDGPSTISKFNEPFGVAVDHNGDIIVADTFNHRIRKILKSNNTVVTIAGGDNGYEDGYPTVSKFNFPAGVGIDSNGDIIIADTSNHRIRKILKSNNTVVTIAGVNGDYEDGSFSVAKFNEPFGIVIDSNDDIIVADALNHRIRRISVSTGTVSTIAGNFLGFEDGSLSVANFFQPLGVVIDNNGDIIVADTFNHRIRKILLSSVTKITITGSIRGFEDGFPTVAKFTEPHGVAIDGNGDIIIADTLNHRIRRISVSTGTVSTIAGSVRGFEDGSPTVAKFDSPYGVVIDNNGDIIVADTFNHRIRKILKPNNTVVTIAGVNGGYEDGDAQISKFAYPHDVAIDTNGDIVVADTFNHRIRKISVSKGNVTTIAGSGMPGMKGGNASESLFHFPSGVACSKKLIYVADTFNNVIRMINTESNIVTTITGHDSGFRDGPSDEAKFRLPSRIAILPNNDIIISEREDNRIRIRSDASDMVFTVASSQFKFPTGIAIDFNGDIIVADSGNHRIQKIVHHPCPIGKFSNTTFMSSVKCKMCFPGTYSNERGTTSCKLCEPGTFNPHSGKDKCLTCPAGYYSKDVGQDSCTPCAIGTYNSREGQSRCATCPDGQFTDQEAQSFCKNCKFPYELDSNTCRVSNLVLITIAILSVLIVIIIITLFAVLCVSLFCWVRIKKMEKKHEVELELKSLLLDDDCQESSIPLNIDISMFEIDMEELTELKEIGSGGSRKLVLKAKWKNRDVVVKLFRYSSLDDSVMEEFINELKFYMSLRDKNVVYFYGACVRPPRIGIVMEYCYHGTLKQYLRKRTLNFKQKVQLTTEIADGMRFLHSHQVIHRDLKSDNILIDTDGHARISDFGISKSVGQELNTARVGTSIYMAPEVTLGKQYNEKCDVFSFGIVMYEILTENFTPYIQNAQNIEFRVANNPTFRPIIPDSIHISNDKMAEYVNLMTNCWSHSSDSRPSFTTISTTLRKL